MQYPLVTISIPTYNQEKYIARAIQSALQQNYSNLEINVCDDCSTDNTFKVAQSFTHDARVRLYRNDENMGRVRNYRKLLYEKANGAWVLNLDGDDYLTDPGFISRAIEYINQCRNERVVLYHANFFDLDELKPKEIVKKLTEMIFLIEGKTHIFKRFRVNYFYHLSALYNRQVARDCGFYSFDALSSDSYSLLKISAMGRVIVDAGKVGIWFVNEKSESRNIQKQTERQKLEDEFENLRGFLSAHFNVEEMKQLKKEYSAFNYRINLYNAAELRDFKIFMKVFLKKPALNIFTARQFLKFIIRRKTRMISEDRGTAYSSQLTEAKTL
jgi:glycosyltransferase involved in cell wall biosynthesis